MSQTTKPSSVKVIKRIDKFVVVAHAGAGVFGTVDFCVAQEDIANACTDTPDKDIKQITKKLRNKLIAIKQSKVSDMRQLSNEVRTMQKIADIQDLEDLDNEVAKMQMEGDSDTHHLGDDVTPMEMIADINRTTSNKQSYFFQLLCFNMDTRSSWMATTTFPICHALESFNDLRDMPEDFIWICYTQLHGALEFLYKTCKPPIGHGDLQPRNIIIGYPDVVPSGLPQLRVIDFGLSKQSNEPISEAERMEDDYRDMATMLYTIMDKREMESEKPNKPEPEKDSDEYRKFHTHLREELVRLAKLLRSDTPDKALDLFTQCCANLWENFGSCATERVASVTEASQKKMQEVIVREFAERQAKIEQELDKIIRVNLQPPSE